MYSFLDHQDKTKEITRSVWEIIDSTKLLSLATVSPELDPWASILYFAPNSNLDLYLLTSPVSHHGIHLQKNPAYSATIFNSQQTGKHKRGLQISGLASLVPDSDHDQAVRTWWKRIVGPGVEKFLQSYRHGYESRMYLLRIHHLKIFDEAIFGQHTWISTRVSHGF
jgi:uncharacterized protein YhbP (UPF0306 family)